MTVLPPRAGVSLRLWVLLRAEKSLTPARLGSPVCTRRSVSREGQADLGDHPAPRPPTHCPVLVHSFEGQISNAGVCGSENGLAGNPGEVAGREPRHHHVKDSSPTQSVKQNGSGSLSWTRESSSLCASGRGRRAREAHMGLARG